MNVLGINAAFHDSAACLVVDGRVVAASEEERFVRIKHHKRPRPFHSFALPFHAIDDCLRAGGMVLDDIDRIAYSFDPLPIAAQAGPQRMPLPTRREELAGPTRFDPWRTVFLAGIAEAPRLLLEDAPWHLRRRLTSTRSVTERFVFVPHHLAHAASAFYPSPFGEAAVMTVDGYGGDATTAYWRGRGTALEPLGSVSLPHSLGLFYEQITAYLGFERSADEYKVMALAAYGEPRHRERLKAAIRVGDGGDYRIAPLELEEWFGPARGAEPLEARHFDVAASAQRVLEETVLELAGWLRAETGTRDLCLAGGVALNCVMCSRLLRESGFRRVWVQPAAGDAGTALGAALQVAAEEGGAPGAVCREMEHTLLGPAWSDDQVDAWLSDRGVPHRRVSDVAGETAELLARGKVVGWFQGRMEFGPRALGARSLLAAPFDRALRDRLNAIKGREDFRPVAPVLCEEQAASWFEDAVPSPFMTFVFRLRPERAASVQAIAHEDLTARIQTVNRSQNRRLHAVLEAFGDRTGCPMLVNTSFNVRGEPIVCSIRDAVATFFTSPLDALVAGSSIVTKEAP